MGDQIQVKNEAGGWISTVATIDSCDRNFWTSLTGGSDTYGEMASDTFVVEFSYLVGQRTFRGKFRANTPQETGQSFEILYDPAHPERNTGTGTFQSPWGKAVIWILGIGFAIAAVWVTKYLKLPLFLPM